MLPDQVCLLGEGRAVHLITMPPRRKQWSYLIEAAVTLLLQASLLCPLPLVPYQANQAPHIAGQEVSLG